jgi:hypothetical protein
MFAAADRSRLSALAAGSRSRRRPDRPVVDREITIRLAVESDARALANLAILDQREPLSGELLVGEVEGELVAACALVDGSTIGDPFQPTQAVRALLELRREQIAGAKREALSTRRHRRRRFRRLHLGAD